MTRANKEPERKALVVSGVRQQGVGVKSLKKTQTEPHHRGNAAQCLLADPAPVPLQHSPAAGIRAAAPGSHLQAAPGPHLPPHARRLAAAAVHEVRVHSLHKLQWRCGKTGGSFHFRCSSRGPQHGRAALERTPSFACVCVGGEVCVFEGRWTLKGCRLPAVLLVGQTAGAQPGLACTAQRLYLSCPRARLMRFSAKAHLLWQQTATRGTGESERDALSEGKERFVGGCAAWQSLVSLQPGSRQGCSLRMHGQSRPAKGQQAGKQPWEGLHPLTSRSESTGRRRPGGPPGVPCRCAGLLCRQETEGQGAIGLPMPPLDGRRYAVLPPI